MIDIRVQLIKRQEENYSMAKRILNGFGGDLLGTFVTSK